jgi:hypothetical protein
MFLYTVQYKYIHVSVTVIFDDIYASKTSIHSSIRDPAVVGWSITCQGEE